MVRFVIWQRRMGIQLRGATIEGCSPPQKYLEVFDQQGKKIRVNLHEAIFVGVFLIGFREHTRVEVRLTSTVSSPSERRRSLAVGHGVNLFPTTHLSKLQQRQNDSWQSWRLHPMSAMCHQRPRGCQLVRWLEGGVC